MFEAKNIGLSLEGVLIPLKTNLYTLCIISHLERGSSDFQAAECLAQMLPVISANPPPHTEQLDFSENCLVFFLKALPPIAKKGLHIYLHP